MMLVNRQKLVSAAYSIDATFLLLTVGLQSPGPGSGQPHPHASHAGTSIFSRQGTEMHEARTNHARTFKASARVTDKYSTDEHIA